MGMKTQENTKEFSVVLNLELGNSVINPSNIDMLYFIEDIFSFSMVGKMVFTDIQGIMEFGPFTGNESLVISYGNESDIERFFYILKVSKVDQLGQTGGNSSQKIEITFVDQMYLVLTNMRFSKSWKDAKISKIIGDVATNFLGVEKWAEREESKETLECFYLPYTWTLNTAMLWLLKRGSGQDSGQPGFCFFNNSKGTNLITLEKLLSQKKLMTISNDDQGLYVFEDINPYLYNKIQSWKMSGMNNDVLDMLSGGVRFGYNSKEKSFLTNEFTYKDMIKDQTILGKKSLFPDISETRMRYENYGESDPVFINNSYKHIWGRQYMKQQMISIICRGHEERYAGGLIHIQWPSRDSSQVYHKSLSGKYLVKSITHSFSAKKAQHYTQNLILMKNGHEDSDFKTLEKSTKKNIA